MHRRDTWAIMRPMLIAIGFLFFGLCSLWYGFTLRESRNKVLSWPQVEGQMIHREVSQSTRAGFTSTSYWRYEAIVKYLYSVNGTEYEGDKLYNLGWITSSSKNRQKFLDTIPDNPPVRYNPENPIDSCLLPQGISSLVWGYGLGIVLVTLGGLSLLAKVMA